MGLREDMAEACRESKAKKDDPCRGEVVITDAHRQEANNDLEELLALATQGCRSGCRCLKAQARFEDRDGAQVVVASCNADPRLVPFSHHGR